jgi:outer membrane protein OmpA-like peptidoglycan-associated protein
MRPIWENNRLGDMTRQQTSTALKAIRSAMIASVIGVSAGLILTLPADAQQRFLGSTSGVIIDLSVLDGGGGYLPAGPGGQFAPNTGGFAQFPPAQKPVSRLEGPLVNRSLTLTPPSSRTSLPTSRTASAAPVLAPPPAAAPQPPVVKTPAPAVAAPKPTPAPVAATVPAPEVPAAPQVTPPPPAAPTATASAETPPPPPAPTQTASRPSASAAGGETRILFDAGSANLNDAAKSELDALATQLKSDTGIRVQLQAYAAGTDETAPDARRLSLSRALKVRSHLIDQGVRSTRMDVRALGVKAEGGPADRVDAVVVRR